jgi:chemotaxis protein methyltransferase CheR
LPPPTFDNSVLSLGSHEFKLFRSLVHERTGIWLRDGKELMLASRLSRRLRHHGLTSFGDYYTYLQNTQHNGDELRELINCVTTNKTSFFRERHHFDFLANTVVSQIQLETRGGAPKSIRVWSAACSTGEEPYSIAMTLLEAAQAPASARAAVPPQPATARTGSPKTLISPGSWKIEVVASDIDTKVLETAVQAIYPDSSLATVAMPLQRKYFLRGKDDMDGKVKVKPNVTGLVQFKNINLMDARWPIDDLFDVIFFRNALIYFNQETQNTFLRRMARYLKPNGYLFLGNSEHIPWLHDILAPLNQTMYRLRNVSQ